MPASLLYNSDMIGILSDSHDNLDALGKAVRFFKNSGCGLILHAGDFVAPFAAKLLGEAGCEVKAVCGNCDGEKEGLKATISPFGTIGKAPFLFTYEGKKIAVTHLNGPVGALIESRAHDLIVFGHTHRPEIRKAGPALVVNPGETGGQVTGQSTVALYDPQTGEISIYPL